MLRRLALLLAASFLLLGTTLHAQVSASLVAAESSIQPGRPFTVALRLVHEPHWHTYWINAGTGYPTSLNWQLPPGWTASDIQWPTPVVLKDHTGTVTGNGYENELLLPVTLTPPANLAPGETVTLSAKAEWLMCKETCIPGDADVTLTLPVKAEPPTTNKTFAAAFAKISAPQNPSGWTITAVRHENKIELTLAGDASSLANPHFFSPDALVQYELPQAAALTSNKLQLSLPVSPAYEGKPTRLTGVLAYGPADKRASLAIDVEFTPAAAATAAAPARDLLPTLLLAFIGGLILNLMPCVFPVLGIKILGFVNQAGSDRKKVTLHGLVFTAGVLASFWILGGLLVTLWAGTGWGTQLQHPEVNFSIAAIFLLFAMSLSGVFEIGMSATRLGNVVGSKTGLIPTFLEGAFITVVATPCSAPFLGTAIGAALTTLPATAAMMVFTAVALGLAFPYLLLSIFPSGVKFLPKPGVWMETFKQAMAFPVYAAVGFFVWIMGAQVASEGKHLLVFFGLTLVGMSAWLYGRYTAPGSKPARVRFGVIGGIVLFVAGMLIGWPRTLAPGDIQWEKWSPAAVAEAQAKGKTIYVDFTARWCATCQTNKAIVFSSTKVKRLFRERGIVTLKADWTNQDPAITAELAKHGRSAVPFNLIYKPGATEPVALPELLTPSIVLDALR